MRYGKERLQDEATTQPDLPETLKAESWRLSSQPTCLSALEEEISQGDASTLLGNVRPIALVANESQLVQLLNTKLFWTDEPEVVLGYRIERRSAFKIDRADITPLFDLLRFILEQDSQR